METTVLIRVAPHKTARGLSGQVRTQMSWNQARELYRRTRKLPTLFSHIMHTLLTFIISAHAPQILRLNI